MRSGPSDVGRVQAAEKKWSIYAFVSRKGCAAELCIRLPDCQALVDEEGQLAVHHCVLS